MNQFLEAALHYASLGWQVFPLAPGQKVPVTKHGVKDATTDESRIRQWWSKWPNANIAVACGAASGVYVVDVDVSASGDVNGLESLKEFPPLPATVRQDTPRGGFHAFYRAAEAPANRNSFRPGIDIRGNGYYVVLAPSIHPNGGRYAWTPGCAPWEGQPADYPDFMRPATRAPWAARPAPDPAAVAPPFVTLPVPYSDDVLRRASLYLAQCDPAIQGQGGHDKLLWAAVAMVHGFLLPDGHAYDLLVREYNPRCIPPWDLSIPAEERDFRRKVSEARKLTPQNQPGWLLNDSAYAPPSVPIEVGRLIASIPTTGEIRADIYSNLLYPDESKREPAGIDYWIAKPVDSKPNRGEIDFLVRPSGLLGDICAWINATAIKEQPFLALGCSLSFLGALFGRKIKDELGSRTNLYCMGIAPSSAGKAHAMNQIRRLCEAAGCTELLGGDDIASDSAIEERISREPATLFLWDEIGHLLSHIKSGISKHHAQVVSLLMKLYSAAGNVYRGREYAEQERQRTIVQPCCCIYGTSTPERFTEGLSPTELQDGWLSRCLVFYSPSSPPKSRGRRESQVPEGIAERVRMWYCWRAAQTTDGHTVAQFVTPSGNSQPPVQIVVPTAPEAERLFVAFDDETVAFGKKHPQLACLWAKGEENARRIALILAAGENSERPAVTAADADYACRLVRHLLLDFGRTVAPEISSSKTQRDKREILAVIERAGLAGCAKREITRASQWANKKLRDAMLEDLQEAGDIGVRHDGKTLRYWTAECFQKTEPKK